MDFKYVSGDEREALYNEVWEEPMTTVAKRYNMSDNGLRKHCKRLGIPLPSSGYWAKLKVGKSVVKTPLPEVYGIYKRYVHNYVIKFKTDLKKLSDEELLSNEELNLLSEKTIQFIKDKCSKIKVKKQLKDPHRLIIEHKNGLINRKKESKEKKQINPYHNYTIIENNKENGAILPINVLHSNINRAYRIIDSLIKTLDDMEGRIYATKKSDEDVGEIIIIHTVFYFEVKEESKKLKLKKATSETKSNLVILFKAQGWFNSEFIENFQYKDMDNEPLELQLGKIIYHMFVLANKFRVYDELKHRDEERKREERERQRRLEQMRNGELEEVKLLEQVVADWDKAQKIKVFVLSMEKAAKEIADKEIKEKITVWIEWAKNKADWLDPLTAKEDTLLGKNKNIFERIIENEL